MCFELGCAQRLNHGARGARAAGEARDTARGRGEAGTAAASPPWPRLLSCGVIAADLAHVLQNDKLVSLKHCRCET